jgi:hypothetical protein
MDRPRRGAVLEAEALGRLIQFLDFGGYTPGSGNEISHTAARVPKAPGMRKPAAARARQPAAVYASRLSHAVTLPRWRKHQGLVHACRTARQQAGYGERLQASAIRVCDGNCKAWQMQVG